MDAASGEIAALAEPPWGRGGGVAVAGRRTDRLRRGRGRVQQAVRARFGVAERDGGGGPAHGHASRTRAVRRRVEWVAGRVDAGADGERGLRPTRTCGCTTWRRARRGRLTFADTGGIDGGTFVEPQLVQFPTFDGRGRAGLPLRAGGCEGGRLKRGDHERSRRAGGAGAARVQRAVPVLFVSRGYCVLAPNVRGSSGYGRTYIHLDGRAQADGLGAGTWSRRGTGCVTPAGRIRSGWR